MRSRYFADDRRLKLYDAQGEYAVYDSVVEFQFGSGIYYLEVPSPSVDNEKDEAEDAPALAAQGLEEEFYALANSPETPENTFQIGKSLEKFKGLTPKVAIAIVGGEIITDDHQKIRRLWLNDLKALEKSIAKKVKETIAADGENACQWRGFTAGD